MSVIFLKILNLSLVAGWMILAVLLIRLFLKKAPKWVSCILWALVALRLLLPFSIESALSLIPSSEVISTDIVTSDAVPEIHMGLEFVNNTVNPVVEETFPVSYEAKRSPLQIIVSVVSYVWIAGVAGMLIYSLISFISLKKSVNTAVPLSKGEKRIRISDDLNSPFVLGIFRPIIYVPSGLDKQTFDYVIRHEKAHIKRGDHFWKPLGFVLLSVYWFNPLCWIAYVLLCRDIEAACDEKVIKNKDKNFMAEYSQALLDCAVQRRRISACPVAFGETGVKGRVKGILSYKKPAFWIILVAFVAIVVTAVCFLTNPKKKDVANTLPELSVTTGNDDISYKADIREFAWTTDEKNGDSSLLQETEVHPEYDESVVVVKLNKTGNPENIVLNFTMEPDKVEVKSFDDKYAENPEVIKDYISDLNYNSAKHSVEVDSKDNLYMTLRASWENQGHVSYVVHLVRDGAEEGDSEAETLSDNDADDSEENASENSDGTKEGDMGIKYEYKDGQYVVDGDQVYQYKKILTGRDRNASCSGKYVVLTNDPDITYERVSQSLFSSNMDDWLTDTIIVDMEALTEEFQSFSVWPTESELISHGFDENEHPETDIAGPTGDPIYAIADGTVISVEFSQIYGNNIVILSKDAQIRYSHLGSINVNELDEVKAGDTIATLGNTGNSTGPHLAISLITDKPHDVMEYYKKN